MNRILLQIGLAYRRLLNPEFLVQFHETEVKLVAGRVSNSFLKDCKDIALMNNITNGFLYAVKSEYGGSIVKCSRNIPADSLQQFRNALQFSR